MTRVLITGKNGFIGQRIARRIPLSRMESVRDGAWKAIDFSAYDCVVHAAGMAHVGYRDELQDLYMAVNRDLTLDIARAAKAAGVRQFIFLSSIIVYGPAARGGETRVITAATPPSPENAYGLSKLEAEQGLSALADDTFRVAIMRLPMVYGRGSRGSFALLLKYAEYLPVFPARCGRRSAIYVENLAEYIAYAIDRGLAGTFFPRDPASVTTPAMLSAIRAAMGKRTCVTGALDPLVRLAGGPGPMRRIFGGLEYSPELSLEIENIPMCTLEEAVRREVK